eukprot:gene25508-31164_t
MTVPTGVFAYDKNIHAFDSDDESDGPDEIDATGYINAPELPVHPRHSSGGAGLFKTLLPVLCLSMLVACDIAVPPSVILSADVIEAQIFNQSDPAKTDSSDVQSAFVKFFSAVQNRAQ